jgi:hypothetical protein
MKRYVIPYCFCYLFSTVFSIPLVRFIDYQSLAVNNFKNTWQQLKNRCLDTQKNELINPKCSDNFETENKNALNLLLDILNSKVEWIFVNKKDGVVVEKAFLSPGSFVDQTDALKGSKHACIKSSGIIDATPEDVFNLFLDNSRVREYNEHCVIIKDVQYFEKKNENCW